MVSSLTHNVNVLTIIVASVVTLSVNLLTITVAFATFSPPELQLNKDNISDTEAPFLDLHLSISNGFVSSKIYDKRDDFDFDIVIFPFLDGDVPRSIRYGVYILNLFGLLECLVMWLISMPVIKVNYQTSPTGLSSS